MQHFFSQGIGDNAQGFANFLLYCFLTEKFQSLFKTICYSSCRHKILTQAKLDNSEKETSINVPKINETSPLIADKTTKKVTPTINAKPDFSASIIKNKKTILDAY